MTRTVHLSAGLLVALALTPVLTGCGTTDTVEVTIRNLAFDPKDITIDEGTEVIWLYEDGGTFHDVIIEQLGVNAGFLQEGEYRHTFDTPGTYQVTCSIHPTMIGTITVDPL